MEQTFIFDKETYLKIKEQWKKSKNHEAYAHIIYNIIRSKPMCNGFTVRTKNIQSFDEWYGFNSAVRLARYKVKHDKETIKEMFGVELPEKVVIELGTKYKYK